MLLYNKNSSTSCPMESGCSTSLWKEVAYVNNSEFNAIMEVLNDIYLLLAEILKIMKEEAQKIAANPH